MRVCSSKGSPHSNGVFFLFFFVSQHWSKFGLVPFRPEEAAAHPGKDHRRVEKGLWEPRMCGNVDRSDNRCGAVVGDGWT